MTNKELNDLKKTLETKFEELKQQITSMCVEVEKINNTYKEIEEEFKIRQGK